MRKESDNQYFVSVIMPCFKMGDFIGEALKSVCSQSHSSWEIIAVDDAGPEDGTRQALDNFQQKYSTHRIAYVRHEENRGVSAARNTGIKLSKGNYCAFLDPDDYWDSKYLEKQLAIFEVDTTVTACFTNSIFVNKNGFRLTGFLGPTQKELENICNSLYKRNFINPSAIIIKSDAVIDVGYFDENPKLQHVEDWDLWLRVCANGYKFKFNDSALSYYRRHEKAATHEIEKFVSLKRTLREKHFVYPEYRKFLLDYLTEVEKDKKELSGKINRIKNHFLFSNLIKIWRNIFNYDFNVLD